MAIRFKGLGVLEIPYIQPAVNLLCLLQRFSPPKFLHLNWSAGSLPL